MKIGSSGIRDRRNPTIFRGKNYKHKGLIPTMQDCDDWEFLDSKSSSRRALRKTKRIKNANWDLTFKLLLDFMKGNNYWTLYVVDIEPSFSISSDKKECQIINGLYQDLHGAQLQNRWPLDFNFKLQVRRRVWGPKTPNSRSNWRVVNYGKGQIS